MTKQVFNIPYGVNFLSALADYVLSSADHVADDIILLPTRRVCRAFESALLERSGKTALMIPKLIPFDSAGEQEEEFFDIDDVSFGVDDFDVIDPIDRLFILTKLVQQEHQHLSYDHAFGMAGELARLIDYMKNEQLSIDALQDISTDQYSEYFKQSFDFLKIIIQFWPAILKESNVIDPSDARVRRLYSFMEFLKHKKTGRVIAAGSTGSLPATRVLLDTVASMSNGQVVLPACDMGLHESVWSDLGETHPQYGMKLLLDRMGIDRSVIQPLPFKEDLPVLSERGRLASQMMLPAHSTDEWMDAAPFTADVLEGIEFAECDTEVMEARVIAGRVYQAQQAGQSVMIVTPDQLLMKRLKTLFNRLNLFVDDSAGVPFGSVSGGQFLRLVFKAVWDDDVLSVLSLLKSDLITYEGQVDAVRELESFARKYRVGRMHDVLQDHASLLQTDYPLAYGYLSWYQNLIQPLRLLMREEFISFGTAFQLHLQLAEQLSSTLWQDELNVQGMHFLRDHVLSITENIPRESYGGLLDHLFNLSSVRPEAREHKCFMVGPIESRLMTADLVIVAGLSEGVFPSLRRDDPFLNDQMRVSLGLPSLSRKVGLMAHDFANFLCLPQVLFTRSVKRGGEPQLTSRFIERLKAVLGLSGLSLPESDLVYSAGQLDFPEDDQGHPVSRPVPYPPVSVRPRVLSATNVERWMRDPYEIYAKYILRLRQLDGLNEPMGVADFGTIIHDVLDAQLKSGLPWTVDGLQEAFKRAIVESKVPLNLQLFWLRRTDQIAAWVVEQELQSSNIAQSFAEIEGRVQLDSSFAMTAKADRIDVLKDGTVSVLDYKTGKAPSEKEVYGGYAPQLVIAAMIAEAGGYHGVSGKVSQLVYRQLIGKRDEGGLDTVFDESMEDLIAMYHQNIKTLSLKYQNENQGYPARPNGAKAPKYSDYEYLERLLEWE